MSEQLESLISGNNINNALPNLLNWTTAMLDFTLNQILFGGLIVGVPVVIIIKTIQLFTKKPQPADPEHIFRDGSFMVDFKKCEVSINGYEYKVSDVMSISLERGLGDYGNGSAVIFTVNDLKKPLHKIIFMTHKSGENLYARSKVALHRAGWKS